jgi:hypothetical protein
MPGTALKIKAQITESMQITARDPRESHLTESEASIGATLPISTNVPALLSAKLLLAERFAGGMVHPGEAPHTAEQFAAHLLWVSEEPVAVGARLHT